MLAASSASTCAAYKVVQHVELASAGEMVERARVEHQQLLFGHGRRLVQVVELGDQGVDRYLVGGG